MMRQSRDAYCRVNSNPSPRFAPVMSTVVLGFAGSFYVLSDIGHHEEESLFAQLPWLLLLLALAAAAIILFTLPMEMRGTGFMH